MTNSRAPDGECYGVIGRGKPRFLIPLGTKSAAIASLSAYNKLRPPRIRFARSLAALSLRAGLKTPVLAGFLTIDATQEEAGVSRALQEVFGRTDLVASIGIPQRGPNRKPVLQAFSRAGDPVGYVKIGWSDVTRARVASETEALAAWGDRVGRSARVPRLAYSGQWRGLQLGATDPLPRGVARWRSPAPPMDALRDVVDLGRRSTAGLGPYLRRQAGRVRPHVGRDRLAARTSHVVESLIERHDDTAVEMGLAHGDWVPWNIATAGDAVYVFDWEHWSRDAPVGLDLLYWHFQVSFVTRRKDVASSLERAVHASGDDLALLGVGRENLSLLARLLLVELAARAVEGVAAGAPENPRFHGPAEAVLGALAAGRGPGS